MGLRNTKSRFGWVAKTLHWSVFVVVAIVIAIGWTMDDAPTVTEKIAAYNRHKTFGLTVLALVLLRLAWRVSGTIPALPGRMAGWERVVAHGTHWAFYGLLVALPLTGWAMASASKYPSEVFGLFQLPRLIAPDEGVREVLEEVHEILAWALILLVAAHVAAAIKHHVIERDDILLRMLPDRFNRRSSE